jgi:hypothetical protein
LQNLFVFCAKILRAAKIMAQKVDIGGGGNHRYLAKGGCNLQ